MYLCIPAKCFPPPYRKQTLAGSAMTCSHSQECFPSIKKNPRNKKLKTKEEKENTFFSLLALDRHKHKICPCIPLNEARQGLLNLSHTRMHQHACPFAQPLLKELLLGAERSFFPPYGKFQCQDVKPWLPHNSLPVMACTRWAVTGYVLSWWDEMKQKPSKQRA